METKILKITEYTNLEKKLFPANEIIKSGGIVAFPTETVYGLGADANNAEAVRKIFIAKNRPSDNPLIVHISDLSHLDNITSSIPENAKILMKAFWPGPLSIVLPKHKDLPETTTAGLETVVVRFPNHPIAQALIKYSNTPIAAPSANLSGKVSPTRAGHVIEDLMGRIPMIIDGGPIKYGLESTVVDCTLKDPVILRPGSVPYEQISALIPGTKNASHKSIFRSPGMKYKHYATKTPIILFSGNPKKSSKCIEDFLKDKDPDQYAVIWYDNDFSNLKHNYQLPRSTYEAGPLLFSVMREADELSVSKILIQGYPWEEMGTAIMNRLEKASDKIIEC